MRRKIALFLCMTLAITIGLTPVSASAATDAERGAEVINAIGIMETDKGDNEDLTASVSRARFAQMLVNISTLKDEVTAECSVSLFSDVKKTHWAAGYIQTAVNQGWMAGYLNGTFKPAQGVTLQEAVSAIVKLLGYSSSDFTGNKVSALMNLYETKGLDNNISKKRTQKLTVSDCINLFYNTLNATTKTGTVYAQTLGYTLDTDGTLDYLSLVNTGVEGPVMVSSNWISEVPFSVYTASIYKYGEACTYADVDEYDVIYYSESFKTIWVYDEKVTGTVETINPDYAAPTSVTLGNSNYSFANSDVKLRFSSMGDIKEGDVVTLILGKDGTIVDVLNIDEYNVTINGVALKTAKILEETSTGSYEYTDYVTFVDASGNEHKAAYDIYSASFDEYDLVSVTYVDGVATAVNYSLPTKTFGSNLVTSDGSALGDVAFAENIKILDLQDTEYISIYPERLSGTDLTSKVLYFELNSEGKISELILNDVTGDMDSYGVYTGYTITTGDKISYNYLIGSTTGSYTTSGVSDLILTEGPIGLVFENNVLKKTYLLSEAVVTSIGTTSVQIKNVKFPLASGYTVYLLQNGEYFSTTIDKISDLSKYTLKAYYDKGVSEGGRIRIIVAESIS